MQNERWILPDGIEEMLPPQAQMLEQLRRDLLDHYKSWGYQLVMPPFIEFLDALLTGTGSDLDLHTFKLTDQVTGRQLGIRADITPQAARMDAHQLRCDHPSRLCYMGTVLRTRPDGFASSRSPLQIGAELYGHAGIESDVEILSLMIDTLVMSGVKDIHLDLGHVGLYRGLAQEAGLNEAQEAVLFEALQRKAETEINTLLATFDITTKQRDMFASLASLNGNDAIERAHLLLAAAGDEVKQALNYLQSVAERVKQRLPELPLHFDLAELRGYHFHTGVVFAAFVPGQGQEIARGGRYDAIGEVFGRARPATGFSADLKQLFQLGSAAGKIPSEERILAPASEEPALQQKIAALRAEGFCVISTLPGQSGGAAEMGCSKVLEFIEGVWQLADAE
ncbi:MAG: ATP phosphoribosyltransferase regulatory subunit [Candidatus Polarisedimenticolaceae bacterium]|nr:ATP phosphoribosyltransferase regulatory subunit [Candidatus Polarisedimenticolaceae bacterium]